MKISLSRNAYTRGRWVSTHMATSTLYSTAHSFEVCLLRLTLAIVVWMASGQLTREPGYVQYLRPRIGTDSTDPIPHNNSWSSSVGQYFRHSPNHSTYTVQYEKSLRSIPRIMVEESSVRVPGVRGRWRRAGKNGMTQKKEP